MKRDIGGTFSLGLYTMQIQLKNLLEESGGEQATRLLDLLTQLSGDERALTLTVFQNVIQKVLAGAERLPTTEDESLNSFEESLYNELLQGIRSDGKLSVINGGKSEEVKKPTLIDLDQARRNRRNKDKISA